MILFAPQLSFSRVILTWLFAKFSGKSMPAAKFEDHLESDSHLQADLRLELERVHQKMIMLAGQHIYRSYPLTWPALAIHFLWFFGKRIYTFGFNRRAFNFGKQEFQAPRAVRLGVWGTIFSDPRVIRKMMGQIEQQAHELSGRQSDTAVHAAIVA
jgi:hypothetical protein